MAESRVTIPLPPVERDRPRGLLGKENGALVYVECPSLDLPTLSRRAGIEPPWHSSRKEGAGQTSTARTTSPGDSHLGFLQVGEMNEVFVALELARERALGHRGAGGSSSGKKYPNRSREAWGPQRECVYGIPRAGTGGWTGETLRQVRRALQGPRIGRKSAHR